MIEPEAILGAWLDPRDDRPPDAARVAAWFTADAAQDEALRRRFGSAVEHALGGGFADWEVAPRDRVALVLLLDQLPRNLFRGSPRAFAGDPRAIELARATSPSDLGTLHPLERYFAILPFMHSERLEDQWSGEEAFRRSAREVAAPFRGLFEHGLGFATRHRLVIERFGRFPHRNASLGRDTTPEEARFLADTPEGF
ncbi:MAG: DUF924 family protein [Myxococcota bacterium]